MPFEVPPTLGRRVADGRERKGWTQKQLAERAGLSVTFVSDVENDKRAIGSEALLRLADALGASLDYIVRGELDPPRARRPLTLPAELLEAAEERGWSVGQAVDLLRAREIVVARRSQGGTGGRTGHTLSKDEWADLFHRLGFADEPTR